MILYHGTGQETPNGLTLYFTPDIELARQFALSLDDSGNYNSESLIYSTEIQEDDILVEDDFDYFDSMAYTEEVTRIVYNPEMEWYIVPQSTLVLIERYTNNL